jgi:hypothetical protein
VSTKALPNGGEHFLGEGVLFARAETGISLKTGLRNSVPAERRITPWTLSAQKDPSSKACGSGLAHQLFCRCNLVDRRSFGFGLLALFIGFVQEPVDDARTLLLLDPSVLRFLLFSEKFVVYFPTHWILHL